MSLKYNSLGTASSAARGILVTSATNATPSVLTVTAGHRQRNGERICIQGVTTLTAINGEWSISSVAATAATLDGSAGNGAFAGTAVVAKVMDRTPFIAKHSAVFECGDLGVAAIFIGTCLIEKADSIDGTQFLYTNSSGVATAGFNDALLSGEIAIPAQTVTGTGSCRVEVNMGRYMAARCSAYTSGTVQFGLLA